MDSLEFRCFLDLLMCSDPWPVEDGTNQGIVCGYADKVAETYGFSGWVDAYHEHNVGGGKDSDGE